MITVGMNYNVRPGKQQEFEAKFDAVLGSLQSADGHVESDLFRGVNDDGSYMIVSEWSDKSRFIEFIRSQTFKDVTDWGKAEILTERPRHKIYKEEQLG
jgi:heme-degrading monooxygenase HmoA